MNKVGAIAAAIGLGAAAVIASTQVTLFVIQPIGAVPDGRTLVISRLTSMEFVDSADGWCARRMGKVNLLCRAAVMARVGQEADVLLRLPYSRTLYLWSTGGATYDR
jgi:hypothetical protein